MILYAILMHLHSTNFSRIFASADACHRWADPWFAVIDKYTPPDRRAVVVVSKLDYMPDYVPKPFGFLRSLIMPRQDMLCHAFAATAHNTIASRQSRGVDPHGVCNYFPLGNWNLLTVDPNLNQSKDELCLLHELSHVPQMQSDGSWEESARNEILAEAFSYAVYAETMPNGDRAIKHENACITSDAYIFQDKDALIHFPGTGPYLKAAQGTEADMTAMRASYYSLHSALRQALGHTPTHADELLEAVEKVIERMSECDPIMPYALHLQETQQYLLSYS